MDTICVQCEHIIKYGKGCLCECRKRPLKKDNVTGKIRYEFCEDINNDNCKLFEPRAWWRRLWRMITWLRN